MHDENFLWDAWKKLYINVGAWGSPDPYFDFLKSCYTQPHRKYHTLSHIERMLKEFNQARHLCRFSAGAVEMAIWFHDAVYFIDDLSRENEEQSALLALGIIPTMGLSLGFARSVENLILKTKHNQSANETMADAQVLLDADLSALGEPPQIFENDRQNIREEYIHVPDDEFDLRTKELFEKLLSRPSIYHTEFFREKYERQARENLKKTIADIDSRLAG